MAMISTAAWGGAALRRRRLSVAMGQAAAGRDDARLRAQCTVLEPLGSRHCRDKPRLPPGPAGLRPVRSAAGRLSLHARGDRGANHRRARRAGPGTGAWVGEPRGWIIGVLLAAAYPGRIASPVVLCNMPGRISDEIKRIYALDRESASAAMRAYGVGGSVPPDARLPARPGLGPTLACATGSSPRWTAPRPRPPPRCTTASRRWTRSRCLPASRSRCCCYAATRAASPRPSSAHWPSVCHRPASTCSRAMDMA